MEKNVIPAGDQPIGVVTTEDIVEGRFVLLTDHSMSEDFGSLSDLPAVKLPDTATEASRARYCISWTAPDREVTPGNVWFVPTPSYDWALRGGWDKTANLPMTSVTVRTTWPGNQESITIPSGTKAIVLTHGAIVTIPSGQYDYSSDVTSTGARLTVLNTTDDGATKAGMLSYSATGSIAEVVKYNQDDASLTVRIIA